MASAESVGCDVIAIEALRVFSEGDLLRAYHLCQSLLLTPLTSKGGTTGTQRQRSDAEAFACLQLCSLFSTNTKLFDDKRPFERDMLMCLWERAKSCPLNIQEWMIRLLNSTLNIPCNSTAFATSPEKKSFCNMVHFFLGVALSAKYGGDFPFTDQQESVRHIRIAAHGGDPRAQTWLGAFCGDCSCTRLAAEQGYCPAIRLMALKHMNGERGAPLDCQEGIRLLRIGAEKGDAYCQEDLGMYLFWGDYVTKDEVEAEKWFKLAAASGLPTSQRKLALMYYHNRVIPQQLANQNHTPDSLPSPDGGDAFPEVIRLLKLSAAQGDTGSQRNLGYFYLDGEGVAKDPSAAAEYFAMAARNNDEEAQYRLGLCYQHGEGVEKNYVLAFDMFSQSSAAGYTKAHWSLGYMYANGFGCTADTARALDLFTKGADEGDVRAIMGLGYYNDELGNEKEAMGLWRLAASQGYKEAYYALGKAHGRLWKRRGPLGANYGRYRDTREAAKWLRLSGTVRAMLLLTSITVPSTLEPHSLGSDDDDGGSDTAEDHEDHGEHDEEHEAAGGI
ncbi:sel1 repeat family protein [Pelomyxa schiedti]|nr:sel1 repeat family protein [Pelomyxa schiedti]